MDTAISDLSPQDFVAMVLDEIESYSALTTSNNFDEFRFGSREQDRIDLHQADAAATFVAFFKTEAASYLAGYNVLADQASRDLFRRLIAYRALGHRHVTISENLTMTDVRERVADAEKLRVGVSPIRFSGLLGDLQSFEVSGRHAYTLRLDAWTLNIVYDLGRGHHRQYFFDREGIVIRPEEGDVVVDGGACFGDTSVLFADAVGPDGCVVAAEPIPRHAQIVRHNAIQNNLQDRIHVVEAGFGAENNGVARPALYLNALADPGFRVDSHEADLPIVTIDETVAKLGLSRVDFIKLDVEGYELPSLAGAAETIESFRPKLAVSAYHKWEDLFELAVYLHSRWPGYEFYLDHYTVHAEETVLYGVHRP